MLQKRPRAFGGITGHSGAEHDEYLFVVIVVVIFSFDVVVRKFDLFRAELSPLVRLVSITA